MSFWEEVKEKAAWAAEQVGEKLEEATETGKTEFQALKVKRQIDHIEDEVGELFRRLGRRAYELWEDEKIEDSEVQGIGAEIRAKRDRVKELEAEIESIRLQLNEFKKEKQEVASQKAEEDAEKKKDEEEGIDGEALWEEDDRDDGTPPPP